MHAELAGVSHPAALTLRVAGNPLVRLEGSLLWTHFGASGPVVLNLSRHWHRAVLEAGTASGGGDRVHVSLLPGETFESAGTMAARRGRRPAARAGGDRPRRSACRSPSPVPG